MLEGAGPAPLSRILSQVARWSQRLARLPSLAPLQGLAQAPANTSLPSVPAPPRSVYHKEGGKLGNSPAACRQLRIIRLAAHRGGTVCLPGPSLLRLLAVPEGSRASQPPPLRNLQEPRAEEGNKAKIWRPELRAGSQGPEAALEGPVSPKPPPHPWSQPFQGPCRGRGRGGASLGLSSPAAALAGHQGISTTEASWAVGGWPQGPQLTPVTFQVVLLLRNLLTRTSRASPGPRTSPDLQWPPPQSHPPAPVHLPLLGLGSQGQGVVPGSAEALEEGKSLVSLRPKPVTPWQ